MSEDLIRRIVAAIGKDIKPYRKHSDVARRALEAIREPTQEMSFAALRDYDLGSVLAGQRFIFTNTDPRLAPAIYRQMIDEALK